LSIDRLKDGRFIGVYSVGGEPYLCKNFSTDGINFDDESPIKRKTQWGTVLGDPSVLSFDLHGKEHIFVFAETERRLDHGSVGVNTALIWSSDLGRTWSSQRVPLLESKQIPNWGKKRFRGTSIPSVVMNMARTHLWVYWSGLYEEKPNHSEVGAGYIGCVDPDNPDETLSLHEGGTLDRDAKLEAIHRTSPIFKFIVDKPQREQPVIRRGHYDWCNGCVDIGGITLGDDGIYYSPIVGGRFSEGECEDTFACGVARTTGFTSWEIRPKPILEPHPHPTYRCTDRDERHRDLAHGRRSGISYPQILKIGSWWYLYFVVSNGNFDGSGDHRTHIPRFFLRVLG
jgi:hypothetical protein